MEQLHQSITISISLAASTTQYGIKLEETVLLYQIIDGGFQFPGSPIGLSVSDEEALRASSMGFASQPNSLSHLFAWSCEITVFLYNLYLMLFSVCVNRTSELIILYFLSQFPTPIHKWNLPNLPKNTEVWLKVQSFFSLFLYLKLIHWEIMMV